MFFTLFSVVCTVHALEDLDELESRVSRKATNTFYSGESAENDYLWQPQTVIYKETTFEGREVMFFTQTADEIVMSSASSGWVTTEWPWWMWSADGKRISFHTEQDTSSFDRGTRSVWFVARSDGTYIRPAEDSAHRCLSTSTARWFNWNPAEPDVSYTIGTNDCGEGLEYDSIYKNTFSDTSASYQKWIDAGVSLQCAKRPISGDGRFMVQASGGYTYAPFYFMQLTPPEERGVKIYWDVPDCSESPEWSGSTGCGINNLHDSAFFGSGSPDGNYWFYMFYGGVGGDPAARWRVRMAAIDAQGNLDFSNDPAYTQDNSEPYDWWGSPDEMSSNKEIQLVWNRGDVQVGHAIPNNFAHMDWCPWGSHAVISDGNQQNPWDNGPTIANVYNETTVEWGLQEGEGLGYGTNYCSWTAWTDWPSCSANDLVVALDYLTGETENAFVFDTHRKANAVGRGYVGLSPDGTKIATWTDWMNPTTSNGDLIIGVLYFPHPPEIEQVSASGGTVTVRFDWNLDGTSRGYTQRGWPHEDNDLPPPPRETELFRLWRSQDSINWAPVGTVYAQIFTRYDFSDGTWSGNDYWEIQDTPGDGTWYYAVTSKEWSGLESRALSNIYEITLSGGSGTGSQSSAYPSDPGDMDDPGTSDFYTSFSPANPELIRYYNIYAEDGSSPTVEQTDRIASIPAGACVDGNCSWVDWLGNIDGSTNYVVAPVDSQGNEGPPLDTVAFAHQKEPATASGQYTIEWDELSGPVCGNDVIEGTEVCDGTDLNGEDCVSQGFDSGSLGCLGDCSGYDTSGCQMASGNIYFVRNGGDDNADGLSDATAWATISKVASTVQNGDIVYFRSQDTWTDATPPVFTATPGVTYDGATYGSGTRATLQATGGNTAGGVVEISASNVVFRGFDVDANSQAVSGIDMCAYCGTSFDNVTIDNCIVHDIHSPSESHWLRGIYVGTIGGNDYTVSNITIKNTIVHTTQRAAIVIYPTWTRTGHRVDTALVKNCTVYNAGASGLSGGWGNAIYVKNDADNVIIEDNFVYGNGNAGIHIETAEEVDIGAPNNLVVRRNIVKENAFGISFMNRGKTMDGVFYNNLVFNNGKSPNAYGSDLSITQGEWVASSVSFYNNIFYNTQSTATVTRSFLYSGWGEITGTPTFNFHNNIFFTGDYPAISICRDDPSCTDEHLVHSNNLVYRTSGAADPHIIYNYYESNRVDYDRTGVLTWEPSAQNTDPLFVDPLNEDLHLQDGSPAIDNGANLGTPYHIDYDGVTRPQGSDWDIGAFEFSGQQIQHHPADTTSPFCQISIDELLAYIELWKQDSTANPMRVLMEGIGYYYSGDYC
jgi:hypothetical protein